MRLDEWQEWHNMVQQEIKRMFPEAELEKPYNFGEEMEWGSLENYRADASLKINGKLFIFEAETYFRQDKIIRFIVFSSFLGADSIVIIFSNQKDVWYGETRVQATKYLGGILNSILVKSVNVVALFAESASDLKMKLRVITP